MRLTKEQLVDYCNKEVLSNAELSMVKELLEYKKIEEELGIDLITLVKALTLGYVFIKSSKYKQKITYISWSKHYIQIRKSHHIHLNMKDYGKTWALTKEELL